EEEILRVHREGWLAWLGPIYPYVHVSFRRGFVDEVALPVHWFVRDGEAIRRHAPLLRRLALFRVHGWGKPGPACPHLRRRPGLDVACWFRRADAEALTASPHLSELQVLQVWNGASARVDARIGRTFARAAAWPRLRELRLLNINETRKKGGAWARRVNTAA